MPTYVFRNQATGEVVEEVHPINAVPERVYRDGHAFERDVMAEVLTQHRRVSDRVRYIRKHPHRRLESEALGVLPEQIPEAMAEAKRTKTKVEFLPDGTATFSSEKQKQEYADAHGYGKKEKFLRYKE